MKRLNCQHILKEDLETMPTKLFIPIIYLADIYGAGHLPGTMFCAMEMAVDKNSISAQSVHSLEEPDH